MKIRRTAIAALAVILLVPSTSCRLAAFDQNGDGTVTRQEIADTLADFFCGDTSTDDGTTDDGATDNPTDGGSTDNGTDTGSNDTGAQQ